MNLKEILIEFLQKEINLLERSRRNIYPDSKYKQGRIDACKEILQYLTITSTMTSNMESTNKKVWIRGNAEHPEKVIEALEKHGGINKHCVYAAHENKVFFIDDVNEINWVQHYETLGLLITTHPDWTEIFPEPEYKFKVGDKVKWPGSGIQKITAQKNLKGKPAYNLDHSLEVSEDALTLYEEPQIKTWKEYEAQATSEGLWGISVKGNVTQYSIPTQPPVGRCFATERAAKSALAMAQISQLMPYYGGEITDEEWEDEDVAAFVIKRVYDDIFFDYSFEDYHFLAFHTKEQRDEFYENNRQLVHDYLMID